VSINFIALIPHIFHKSHVTLIVSIRSYFAKYIDDVWHTTAW